MSYSETLEHERSKAFHVDESNSMEYHFLPVETCVCVVFMMKKLSIYKTLLDSFVAFFS